MGPITSQGYLSSLIDAFKFAKGRDIHNHDFNIPIMD